jgi:LPS export ABC transporter protein LptC
VNGKGKIFLIVVAAAFLYLVFWTVTSIPDPPTPKPPDDSPRLMTYEDNVISERKDGKVIWELKAKKISINIDTQDSTMEGIEGRFFAEDGRVVEITARGGVYNQTTQNVVLDGEIKAKVSDGAELTADKLAWDSAKGLLSVEGNVKAKKDDMRASGDRAETTDGFRRFKIIGHAHIEKGVRDEKN